MSPSIPTYVVLGLLAKRSGSGYDIVAFAERSVSFFWPLSRSQLYAELSRLEELGWATGTTIEQDRYPNKRVYDPTPAGLEALRDWLESPAIPQRQRTRDSVVLKTFLGSFMNPDRLAEQLSDYRDEAAERRAMLLTVIARLDGMEPNSSRRFGRATARYGVLQAEATIAWIEEVQELVRREADLLAAGPGPAD